MQGLFAFTEIPRMLKCLSHFFSACSFIIGLCFQGETFASHHCRVSLQKELQVSVFHGLFEHVHPFQIQFGFLQIQERSLEYYAKPFIANGLRTHTELKHKQFAVKREPFADLFSMWVFMYKIPVQDSGFLRALMQKSTSILVCFRTLCPKLDRSQVCKLFYTFVL